MTRRGAERTRQTDGPSDPRARDPEVVRGAAGVPGADGLALDVERRLAHGLGELFGGEGGPDDEDAAGGEGGLDRGEAVGEVELGVAVGDAVGAVVDVEHDGVVAAGRGADDVGDVVLDEVRARVVERVAGEVAVDGPVPAHDVGHELGDVDVRGRGQAIEGGAQREPEAEAADEQARRGDAGDLLAGDPAELVLGLMVVAVHQIDAVDADREVVAVTRELDLTDGGADALEDHDFVLRSGDQDGCVHERVRIGKGRVR
jgi:hypothetical protein